MWSEIVREFEASPSQAKVAKFLLENGFSVNERGRVTCNGLEIPSTQVARATGTDRRVVDATTQRILTLPLHRTIFSHMRVTPDLSGVAHHLGLSVLTIYPKDASERGIVSAAVRVISDAGLSIRQIYVTDPLLSEDPRLVIIVDGDLPPSVIEGIHHLPQVRQIVL
ncbi:MAG: regulator of amino acid metabolism, contains ACT domain protein [Methanolinea sp.]|nr:regulator of amino acid metabolism, contains ACT domain protein [Methanolinea sp.]